MKHDWHVYALNSPIDFQWERLRTVKETALEIAKEQIAEVGVGAGASLTLEAFLNSAALCDSLVNPDRLRHETRVFWVPAEIDFLYGFVLKEDNNGSTYVVSPVELPYLEKLGEKVKT